MGDRDGSNFGLELVLFAHSGYFKRKVDVVTCLVHWKLLTVGKLRCVGLGEEFSVTAPNELPGSEILRKEAFPDADKSMSGVALKYRGIGDKECSKYLLKLTDLDSETYVINVIRVADEKVLTLRMNPDKIISDSFKSNSLGIRDVFIDFSDVSSIMDKEIFNVLFPTSGEKAVKSDNDSGCFSQNEESRRQQPFFQPYPRRPFSDIIHRPFLGRGDLDPFAPDGGGMIMDPFAGGRGRSRGNPDFDPAFPGMRSRGYPGP